MNGITPAAVLAALVAVTFITVGAIVTIFLAGGPLDAQIARAGIITAITGSVIAALMGLVIAGRAEAKSNAAVDSAGKNARAIDGHSDELEAAQTRIAFLEARAGMEPYVRPYKEDVNDE